MGLSGPGCRSWRVRERQAQPTSNYTVLRNTIVFFLNFEVHRTSTLTAMVTRKKSQEKDLISMSDIFFSCSVATYLKNEMFAAKQPAVKSKYRGHESNPSSSTAPLLEEGEEAARRQSEPAGLLCVCCFALLCRCRTNVAMKSQNNSDDELVGEAW